MNQEPPEKAVATTPEDIGALINAFRFFNETATTLTQTYRGLQTRVVKLTEEIEEKDRQLYGRLKELDRVTRYLNGLLESMSSGVIGIDLEGHITIFNRTAAEITGYKAEEAIGKVYEDILGLEGLENGALYTLQNGQELRGVERIIGAKKARVSTNTLWIVDSLSERIGVVELFDDISEIRRLEERIQHQKTLAALGEMASMVAHELRNPLNGISSFAILLKDRISDEEGRAHLNLIMEQVKKLDRLAANLLYLAKPADLRMAPTDLKVMLSDIRELLAADVMGSLNPPEISIQFPPENLPVTVDRDFLHTALFNLGRNALQAMPDGGRLTFAVKWNLLANRVDLIVEDTGVGIDESVKSKLFSPFFTTKPRGSGMGLAMVKKAVDLHRGTIDVITTPGAGAKFTISLPIRGPEL